MKKNYGNRYWSKYVSELQVSLTRCTLKNEVKSRHYLKECLSKAVFGRPTKSRSGIKLFYKIDKKGNTYVTNILSNIFIRNLCPYLKES